MAANQHRSGRRNTGAGADGGTAQEGSSDSYAEILAARDGSHPGYEFEEAAAERDRSSGQGDRSDGPEEGQYVPAAVAYSNGEGQEMRRPETVPDRPKPVFEGRYERREPPRGTSVRAIDHGKSKLRISPFSREGGTKKSKSKNKADAEEGEHMTMEAKLVKCPGCGAEVSEKSVVCVSCGEFLRK